MDDLTITRLCAEAMGQKGLDAAVRSRENLTLRYDPLHDDAQAMALVKKFELAIMPESCEWTVTSHPRLQSCALNADLNRAIVECVAKMQKEKATA